MRGWRITRVYPMDLLGNRCVMVHDQLCDACDDFCMAGWMLAVVPAVMVVILYFDLNPRVVMEIPNLVYRASLLNTRIYSIVQTPK